MNLFLLVVLLLVTLSMIGIILLQRSESGGLGSSGGMGGLMSARGRKDFMTRTTAVLATCFMILCILLAILSGRERRAESSLVTEASADAAEEILQTDAMPPISDGPSAVVPAEVPSSEPVAVAAKESKVAPTVASPSEGKETPKVVSSKAKKASKKKKKVS